MALSDPYATPQQYRDAIRKGDQDDDPTIDRNLKSISRYIEKKCHDFWNKDDAPVQRVYSPPIKFTAGRITASGIGFAESENPWVHMRGDLWLLTDPISALDNIIMEVDVARDQTFTQTLTTAEYIALPRNASVGPEPKPYRYFQRSPQALPWQPGSDVRITAIFGWPEVPSAIIDLTIEIAAILRIESIRATSRMNEMDSQIDASNECQAILHRLMNAYKPPTAVSY